jgi:protein SCO1/2
MYKPTWLRGCLLLLIAMLLGACSGDDNEWHAKSIARLMPPLDFELTDENGKSVTAADYRGKTVMLFFGFTHCPHFCPMTLAKLARVLDQLPNGVRQDVRVLFVSVDPDRDTPRRLAAYTDNFAPEVIGLTGTEAHLRALAKRYRTTFSYGPADAEGNYNVSHGLAIYVFDRQGKARLMILKEQTIGQIADDVRRLTAKRP